MTKQTDDEKIVNLLSPVVEMWKNHSNKSFEEACLGWELAFSANNAPSYSRNVIWLFFKFLILMPLKLLLSWYKYEVERLNLFENRTLKRLKKWSLVKCDPEGQLIILPAPIDPALGQGLIYFLMALTGFFAGWVMFCAKVNLQLIINSGVVGVVIGTMISLVMDLSYTQKYIHEKLHQINLN